MFPYGKSVRILRVCVLLYSPLVVCVCGVCQGAQQCISERCLPSDRKLMVCAGVKTAICTDRNSEQLRHAKSLDSRLRISVWLPAWHT